MTITSAKVKVHTLADVVGETTGSAQAETKALEKHDLLFLSVMLCVLITARRMCGGEGTDWGGCVVCGSVVNAVYRDDKHGAKWQHGAGKHPTEHSRNLPYRHRMNHGDPTECGHLAAFSALSARIGRSCRRLLTILPRRADLVDH